jgi:hypothetical protein
VNRYVRFLSTMTLGLAASFAAASQCAAGQVALEQFVYPVGNRIAGEAGAAPNAYGWAGPWTDGTGPDAFVVRPGLTYTDANGVSLATAGNALGPTTMSGIARRLLHTPIAGTAGTTLIVSAIVESNVNGATFTQATLGNSSGGTFIIGELPETDPRAANWGLQNSAGVYYSTKLVKANVPTWLVAQIDFAVSGGKDRMRLWVDPPVGAWSTVPPDVDETTAHVTTFSGFFWQTQQGQKVDEISVSTALSSACVPPPNTTMVAWYPFDSVAGTPASTPNLATGNSGEVFNGPTLVAGVVGNALSFNGTDDYVDSPSSLATNFGPANPSACTGSGSYSSCSGDFSIDAWIQVPPAAAFDATVILDKRTGFQPAIFGYSFFLYPGTGGLELGLQLADGIGSGFDNYLSPGVALADGAWHHVAVTVRRKAPAGIRWYHNGALIGIGNPTGRQGSLVNSSPLRIGARTAETPLTGFFEGALDELEIFNRVLLPAEVQSLYNAGSFGKCK